MDEEFPEEEVLAFLFFLSFPSFFFSAKHKKRVSAAALALQQQRCWVIPLPAWFLSCLEFPSVPSSTQDALCTRSALHLSERDQRWQKVQEVTNTN